MTNVVVVAAAGNAFTLCDSGVAAVYHGDDGCK